MPIIVEKDEGFELKTRMDKTVRHDLKKNKQDIKMIDDFKVLNFLNKNDIGTDATRTQLLNQLIDLKYLVSNNILLTTLFGNKLINLSEKYVSFIDKNYTLDIENKLNEIETGIISKKQFKNDIKNTLKITYEKIYDNIDNVKKILLDIPLCEVHKIPMVFMDGMYGKFLVCPYYFSEIKCNQKFSI
jgi:DNA topoisomerase IA